ncbi:cytidine deaminase [Mariniblastus sp.]|jgi:cytidine deaminase|nr:cytidine deaminase [Mariniblastus sp.]MDB4671796.1 cytidine deaminase [Pirellulaceae bacterium]MDB4755751.1 cytidine deaminase [Mariniblastus sp.]
MKNLSMCQKMIDLANQSRERAYAPYSGFLVGASVLAEDGSIFAGCNVENASYGLTLCAERVAICNAVAAGQKSFQAVCVVSKNAVAPCGACRQFIAEFGLQTVVILVDAVSLKVRKESEIHELIPESFVFPPNG